MQFTKNEFTYLAQHVEHCENSGLRRYQRVLSDTERTDALNALRDKGVISEAREDAPIVDGMLAVLTIIACPERVAHFELRGTQQLMVKSVFTRGDKRILLEYLQEDILVSMYDNEAESVRQEISNQTGVSFQRPLQLSLMLTPEAFFALLATIDALRANRLAQYSGCEDNTFKSLLPEALLRYWEKPLPQGVITQINPVFGFELPSLADLKNGLETLVERGLVNTRFEPNDGLTTLAHSCLLPYHLITLSLVQPGMQAQEAILQGSLKLGLAISENQQGYQVDCMAGVEILNRIDAYLACPIIT